MPTAFAAVNGLNPCCLHCFKMLTTHCCVSGRIFCCSHAVRVPLAADHDASSTPSHLHGCKDEGNQEVRLPSSMVVFLTFEYHSVAPALYSPTVCQLSAEICVIELGALSAPRCRSALSWLAWTYQNTRPSCSRCAQPLAAVAPEAGLPSAAAVIPCSKSS